MAYLRLVLEVTQSFPELGVEGYDPATCFPLAGTVLEVDGCPYRTLSIGQHWSAPIG
jgi:hypothetical protein